MGCAFPFLTTPKARLSKRIKKRNLSEPKASLFRFPFWQARFWEPAQRATAVGSPFLLTFLAKQKSERPAGAGPGKPPTKNLQR
jgi:hypothetical protein